MNKKTNFANKQKKIKKNTQNKSSQTPMLHAQTNTECKEGGRIQRRMETNPHAYKYIHVELQNKETVKVV